MSAPREPTAAELYATEEAAARARIDAGRQRLESFKRSELEEAEATALARIRRDTEQTLARQAEALRDAERQAEQAAIERRSNDLEAARVAQQRIQLEEAAKQAAVTRTRAEQEAAAAAEERFVALQAAATALDQRRQAVKEMKAAVRANRRGRWRCFWAGLGVASPFKAAALALALGGLGGYLGARLDTGPAPLAAPDRIEAVQPAAAEEGRRLRLSHELAGPVPAAP